MVKPSKKSINRAFFFSLVTLFIFLVLVPTWFYNRYEFNLIVEMLLVLLPISLLLPQYWYLRLKKIIKNSDNSSKIYSKLNILDFFVIILIIYMFISAEMIVRPENSFFQAFLPYNFIGAFTGILFFLFFTITPLLYVGFIAYLKLEGKYLWEDLPDTIKTERIQGKSSTNIFTKRSILISVFCTLLVSLIEYNTSFRPYAMGVWKYDYIFLSHSHTDVVTSELYTIFLDTFIFFSIVFLFARLTEGVFLEKPSNFNNGIDKTSILLYTLSLIPGVMILILLRQVIPEFITRNYLYWLGEGNLFIWIIALSALIPFYFVVWSGNKLSNRIKGDKND